MVNSVYLPFLFGLNDIENKNVPWLLSLSILKSGFFNSAIFNEQTVFNTVPMHFKWLSTYNEPFVSKMPKMSAIKKRLSSILRLTYFSWSKGHYGKCQKWHFKVKKYHFCMKQVIMKKHYLRLSAKFWDSHPPRFVETKSISKISWKNIFVPQPEFTRYELMLWIFPRNCANNDSRSRNMFPGTVEREKCIKRDESASDKFSNGQSRISYLEEVIERSKGHFSCVFFLVLFAGFLLLWYINVAAFF